MNKNISGKTKYMRQRKNLSPYALATKAGVAQSTLSYIEKGARQPQIDTLQALYTALDITTLELSTCSTRRQPCALLSGKRPEPASFLATRKIRAVSGYDGYLQRRVARRQCTVSL